MVCTDIPDDTEINKGLKGHERQKRGKKEEVP
jgi:hypothetical protein